MMKLANRMMWVMPLIPLVLPSFRLAATMMVIDAMVACSGVTILKGWPLYGAKVSRAAHQNHKPQSAAAVGMEYLATLLRPMLRCTKP